MEIAKLEQILEKCWTKETSSDAAGWTPENPAFGQCAVTACIVNDYFGGKLVWAPVNVNGKEVSHYFNNIDGKEIDLTKKQFPAGAVVPQGIDKTKGLPTTRDYVLSFQATIDRYALLKSRVEKEMNA
jgi:hypothetical protein